MTTTSVGLEVIILKESQLLDFWTENLSSLGTSQFRFQYQSFRLHLILNPNGTEVEPNYVVPKWENCK